MANYWLTKTEPETFSWDDLVAKGTACWDGVRNVEARNHLRAMAEGDTVFIYHTGETREIVGVAKLVRTAYRDPTSSQAIWSAVDVSAVRPLPRPVKLATLKAEPLFASSPLARRPRLSVVPLTDEQAARILALSETISSSAH
jgi:predicted RNA-binding protein with PUA-like domain